MGLVSKTVIVKWSSNAISWYKSKGYIYTKYNDELEIKVEDLQVHSNVEVICSCDSCKKEYEVIWQHYYKRTKKDGKNYCKKCAPIMRTGENVRLSKLKNGISFKQWCVDNNRIDILELWDYELNNYLPSEITYASNSKQWFKCKNGIHGSELKNIGGFTVGSRPINCEQCNSFGQWLLDNYGVDAINKYWSNKNSISPMYLKRFSSKKSWFICPDCKEEKEMYLNNFIKYGLGCKKCSDGISYPEKFINSLLNQLNINYITQLSKSNFNWCSSYRYDVFLPTKNIIVEIHGLQHYNYSGFKNSLDEEQKNDKAKKKLAFSNGFNDTNYIILDARYSELEYIKNSIINSNLLELLMFKENNIDWLKCHEFALCNYVKIICDMWNKTERNNIKEIIDITKLSYKTILNYLKSGAKCGWCVYDSGIEMDNKNKRIMKSVYCVELKKMFESTKSASLKLNICAPNITDCCNGRQKTAGKLQDGTKLHWMYYEDYLRELEIDSSFLLLKIG